MPDEPTKPVAYQDVVEAVDALLDEGMPKDEMSVRVLRAKVGNRGSFNTLIKHRDRYFAELGEPVRDEFVTDDDLAAVRSTLNGIVARQIEADRAQADFEREAYRAQIRALQAKVTDLEDVAVENEGRVREAQAMADAAQRSEAQLELRAVAAEAALKELRATNKKLTKMLEVKVKPSENDEAAATSGPCDEQPHGTDTATHRPTAEPASAANATLPDSDVENEVEDFEDERIFPMDHVPFNAEAVQGGRGTEPA